MCVCGGGGGGGASQPETPIPLPLFFEEKNIWFSSSILRQFKCLWVTPRISVYDRECGSPPPPSVGIWFVHEYIYAYEPRIARILSTPILCCLELCHRLRPWVDEWGVSAAISTPPPPIGIRIWLNCCFVYICIRSSIAKILATPMHSLWVTPRILVYDHGMINEGWVGQGPTSPPPPPLLGFYSCTCIRSPIARFLAEPMHACV